MTCWDTNLILKWERRILLVDYTWCLLFPTNIWCIITKFYTLFGKHRKYTIKFLKNDSRRWLLVFFLHHQQRIDCILYLVSTQLYFICVVLFHIRASINKSATIWMKLSFSKKELFIFQSRRLWFFLRNSSIAETNLYPPSYYYKFIWYHKLPKQLAIGVFFSL